MPRRLREDKHRWTITYWFYPKTRHRLWVLGLTVTLTKSARQRLANRPLTGWICTRLTVIRQIRVKWRIQITSMPTLTLIKGISCRRQLRNACCFCSVGAGLTARPLNTKPHSLAARPATPLLIWLRERLYRGLPPLDCLRLVTQSADGPGGAITAPRRWKLATLDATKLANTHVIQEPLPDGNGLP